MNEPPSHRARPVRAPGMSSPVPDSSRGAELRSETLFAGRREVLIVHGSEQYRLRLTRMNKLILTK